MITSPKRCQGGQPCEPETLSEAIYCLAHHSRIPLKQIAEAIGKRPGYLADAANPDLDTVAFQAVSLVPAMRAAGNYGPLQFMARQLDCVLVSLPSCDTADDVRRRFMATAKELGDVALEIERGLAGDDEVDAVEFARIDRELSDVVEAVSQMRHALLQKRKKRSRP